MSRQLAQTIKNAAVDLDRTLTGLLKELGVPAPTYYVWKNSDTKARSEKANHILLMLDGLRYRQEDRGFAAWLRSLHQ